MLNIFTLLLESVEHLYMTHRHIDQYPNHYRLSYHNVFVVAVAVYPVAIFQVKFCQVTSIMRKNREEMNKKKKEINIFSTKT